MMDLCDEEKVNEGPVSKRKRKNLGDDIRFTFHFTYPKESSSV
jgi:hypothetical protein